MMQPRKPKGAPNSAGGQYDTYAHTTPSGLPALDGELAWERERGEGGRVEQSQQPAPPVGVTDGGYGRVDPYLPSPVRPDLVEGVRVNGDLGAIPLQFRDLTWTEWDRVRMGGANLNGANLTEARFDRVDAHDANLVRADLTGAVIRDSSLRGVRAAGVDLPHAQVTDTDMRGADLRNADVDHAALRNVDLSGARVEGVAFHRAGTLSNVDLTGTGLTGASGTFDGLGQMSVVLGDRSQGVCRYERTVDGTHAGFYPPTPWVNRCGTRTCRRPPNGVCPRCGSPVRPWRWRCTHGGWARMRCACWTRTPITSMGCGGIRTSRCARPRWTRSAASPSHSDLCAVWDA